VAAPDKDMKNFGVGGGPPRARSGEGGNCSLKKREPRMRGGGVSRGVKNQNTAGLALWDDHETEQKRI